MDIVETSSSAARHVLVPETALASMTGGRQAIAVAWTATYRGTLLDMAQIPVTTILGKADSIHGRTTAQVLDSAANPRPVVLGGGMPLGGSLQFADLRRCSGETAGSRFYGRRRTSSPTEMRCPPQPACRQKIGAIASRPDPGTRHLEQRSAALKWETGAKMDGCRRRCRQSIGPMPRQTSCGDHSTPPAMAPARNPVSHTVPQEPGRVDAPPCSEVANCR